MLLADFPLATWNKISFSRLVKYLSSYTNPGNNECCLDSVFNNPVCINIFMESANETSCPLSTTIDIPNTPNKSLSWLYQGNLKVKNDMMLSSTCVNVSSFTNIFLVSSTSRSFSIQDSAVAPVRSLAVNPIT